MVTVLFASALLCRHSNAVQVPQGPLKLAAVEDMLLYSGSEVSYSYVEELAARNKEVVPLIAKMFVKKYDEEDVIGSFPDNAIRVLALVSDKSALALLQKRKAALAVRAWKLKNKYQSKDYGLMDRTTTLFGKADYDSKKLGEVKVGTEVQILKRSVKNDQKEGPRGGPSIYDKIKILQTKQEGYIERTGLGFIPNVY